MIFFMPEIVIKPPMMMKIEQNRTESSSMVFFTVSATDFVGWVKLKLWHAVGLIAIEL